MRMAMLRRICGSLVRRVRSCVARRRLESGYARMAEDKEREGEALQWAEATFKDVASEVQ